MDYFAHAWSLTGAIEKGYSNRPPDPETMHGITIAVARAHGWTGPMRELPIDVATRIARTEYWDRLRLDEIAQLSPSIAYELFDTNFNLWEGAAGQFLQQSINAAAPPAVENGDVVPLLKVDGLIGSMTIARLGTVLRSRQNGEAELILLRMLNSLQCADYMRQVISQPWKRQFLAGWILKRVTMDAPAGARV